MSLFDKIKSALTPIVDKDNKPIPVKRLRLSSTDVSKNYDQYIIVTFYNTQGALFADDEEIQTAHSIQLSLFTRLNFENTVKQIKSLLKPLGFSRQNEYEIYEEDTGYYHKVIRFIFVENTEDGE